MTTIEEHRAFWAKVAREHGWYSEPFHVITWHDRSGAIVDSVSYDTLGRDFSLPY